MKRLAFSCVVGLGCLYSMVLNADILVLRSKGPDFKRFFELLNEELGDDYKLTDHIVDRNGNAYETLKAIHDNQPKLVVLLDNIPVKRAKKLINQGHKLPPMVATMSLNLRNHLKGVAGIAGIGYEVSAYSMVHEFNRILAKKIRRVKVLYRKSSFQHLIDDAVRQLGREKISLHAVNVEDKNKAIMNKRIQKELTRASDDAEALLILLDSKLITQENFVSIWINQAKRATIPFLCGIEKFARKPINLCSFAAYPDPSSLASHVADMVHSIVEDGIKTEEIGVEYIVSNQKILNQDKIHQMELKIKTISIDGLEIIRKQD